jgi:hypothetical protein
MRGTTTISSMTVETSDGEMMRAVLRSLTGFLRGEGPGHGLRHARQRSLGLRFLSYPMWIVIVTRR